MKLHLLGTTGYHPNARRHTACLMLPEQGIVLDAALLERAKHAAAKAGYASVDEYVAHVVENALNRSDDPGGAGADAEEIKKKLEGLGYIS